DDGTPAQGLDEHGTEAWPEDVDRRSHRGIGGHGASPSVAREDRLDGGEGQRRDRGGAQSLERAGGEQRGEAPGERSRARRGDHDGQPDDEGRPDAEDVAESPEDRA